MNWMITEDNHLYLKLDLNSTYPIVGSWTGIGFGPAMRQSQMVVCKNSDGKITLQEHLPNSEYLAPAVYQGSWAAVGLSGDSGVYSQSCTFQRSLKPNDTFHLNLDPSNHIGMIWAFNPSTGINWYGEPFTFHQPNHRGAFQINFITGTVEEVTVPNFTLKQIHGFTMMFVWVFLFPAGAFYARYFRSIRGWLVVKIGIQFSGVVLVMTAMVIVVASIVVYGAGCSISGTVILSLLAVQITLGILSRLGLQMESLESSRINIKAFHRIAGYMIMAAGIIQSSFGLRVLYPIEEPREIWPWVIYISLICLVVLSFVIAEVVRLIRFENHDLGYHKVPTQLIEARLQTAAKIMEKKTIAGHLNFTWESLDKCINAGKMYVVANGKYVYDISIWINSHPGGRIILDAVNGTDISNDFFHEAGFDAEEYVPKPLAPRRLEIRTPKSTRSSYSGSASTHFSVNDRFKSAYDYQMNAHHLSSIDDTDWKYIKLARRTHVHSRLAIETLSSLMVGTLSPRVTPNSFVESSSSNLGFQFDPFEYRRYTITKITRTVDAKSNLEVLRLRFCLLYPFDIRDNQPLNFLPGQSVEIQSRVSGKRVSRYYTPLCGNMNAFDIIVKVKVGGEMSQYLNNQDCGVRQFKVRGPFGGPLVLDFWDGYNRYKTPETVFFITEGSGISACTQFVNHLYLSTDASLNVSFDFEAQLSDEMSLQVGEQVRAIHQYHDGWCYGVNTVTGQEGSYPVGTVDPVGAVKVILVYVNDNNDTYMGSEIIGGAKLAYPQLVESEFIAPADLNGSTLIPILEKYHSPNNSKIFICGSTGLMEKLQGILGNVSMKTAVFKLGNQSPSLHEIK
ncbi:S-methyl-5-thioribose-1-phosphate isomerase [Boothiomyces sp. JEL0838]|nr:S-methyl-5-thioribose-1-phosphate isomerase [Boothiomyces sp. JEL0838]